VEAPQYVERSRMTGAARVLAQPRGEVLNDAEVQKFRQLVSMRFDRRALSETAAQLSA
jgi:hypothetical protein